MMRRNAGQLGTWLFVVGMLFAVMGCATTPPARQVTSLQQVAGKWEGTVTGPGSTLSIKNMIVKPDGAWELDLVGGNPPRHTGTVQLVDGKLRGRSATTGNASTWTLHEADGKRVLKIVNDGGTITSELTPAR